MKKNAFSIVEMLVVLMMVGVIVAMTLPVLTVKKAGSVSQTSIVPIGTVLAFAKAASPNGYLECNGSAVSRTTYKDLFNVIGTTYGPGDGSTTFNLPDLRGEFIRGWSHEKTGVDDGRTFASSQTDELKAHSHSYTTYSATGNGSGTGSYWVGAGTGNSGETGGTETRPRNVAMMYIIRAK